MLGIGILIFALYFFGVQMAKDYISTTWWRVILLTVVVGMLALFALPFRRPSRRQRPRQRSDFTMAQVTKAAADLAKPARDVSGLQMLTYPDFWMFVFVCTVGQGCGLMFLSNASEILPALAGHDMSLTTTSLVAGISVFNALARLVFGMFSEILRGKVPRTVFLVAAIACLTLGYLLLWMFEYPAVWPCAMLIGFGYGGLWGVQPLMVGELFGLSDFSFKYSCSTMAAAMGSLIFNEALAGPIYDRHAEGRPEFPRCYIAECFSQTFFIAALAGLPALFVACVLVKKTRWIYLEPAFPDVDGSSSESESEAESARAVE